MQPNADFLKQAQATLEKVVRAYRPTALAAYGRVEHELKADKTVVTKLDKELEQLMRDALTQLDAGVGIIGEELGAGGNKDTFWLLDPIDGTESFIRGLPFVFNLATLIDNGVPIFTFVYRFISDELFVAVKGQGATKDGQALQVSRRPMDRAIIELSTKRYSEPSVMAVTKTVEPHIYRFRRFEDFTFTPQGRVDGNIVYRSGGGDWDYAPRALLIAEAGGRVANIGSETYDYRDHEFVAANPVIFDDLMALVTQAAKEKA